MRFLARLFARNKARQRIALAKAAYDRARAEWNAAESRQDTRRKHHAELALRSAHVAWLKAERMGAAR